MITQEEKSQRGKHAAHVRWAKADPAAESAKARERMFDRFRKQAVADADGPLEDPEVERRAQHLLKAHMADLTRRSIKARRERAS